MRLAHFVHSAAWSALVASAGCSSGEDSTPANIEKTRPFLLASTGVEAHPGQAQFFAMGPANLADDVDMVSVHQDFFGVPWAEFASNKPAPAAWTALMDQIKSTYAGRRIFLTLQLAGGSNRRYLADRAVVDASGTLTTEANWSAECYDFATASDGTLLRRAYTSYVTWMVTEFDPEYVNVGAELNMFMACGAAWDGMVATERAAYEAAKAAKPSAIVFPSIQLDMLYGRQQCTGDASACYEQNYAKLANLKRDRFAVSTYPMGDPTWKSPADVDADYTYRAADRGGERLVFAETGWDSHELAGTLNGTCTIAKTFTDAEEDAWLERVLRDGQAKNSDLVTWWSNRDFLPRTVSESCTYDASWQPVVDSFRAAQGSDPTAQFVGEIMLKFFGSMGIRENDGTPKGAVFDRWKTTQARKPAVVR